MFTLPTTFDISVNIDVEVIFQWTIINNYQIFLAIKDGFHRFFLMSNYKYFQISKNDYLNTLNVEQVYREGELMKENFYLRLTVKKLRKCKMTFWLNNTLFENLSLCLTCILQILFEIILDRPRERHLNEHTKAFFVGSHHFLHNNMMAGNTNAQQSFGLKKLASLV